VPARKIFRVYSWNVNGIRSVVKKGFFDWLKKARADVVALQETRIQPDQISDEIGKVPRWRTHFVGAEKKGYSGVGLYARQAPDELRSSLDRDELDREGRLQLARWGELWIANVYFPNGSGPNRDHSRVPYKLSFYQRLFEVLEPLRREAPVLCVGDFNTAHEEIDLARPKSNKRTSGFLEPERAEVSRWIQSGWTDTFRHLHPDATDMYSWWSQRYGVRERNVGWRIDMILASEQALPYLKTARIHTQVMGSDHCPISVDLDPAILGR